MKASEPLEQLASDIFDILMEHSFGEVTKAHVKNPRMFFSRFQHILDPSKITEAIYVTNRGPWPAYTEGDTDEIKYGPIELKQSVRCGLYVRDDKPMLAVIRRVPGVSVIIPGNDQKQQSGRSEDLFEDEGTMFGRPRPNVYKIHREKSAGIPDPRGKAEVPFDASELRGIVEVETKLNHYLSSIAEPPLNHGTYYFIKPQHVKKIQ